MADLWSNDRYRGAKYDQHVLSPSGKYRLIVQSYSTGPHSWNVTRGLVTHADTNEPIADVKRNYSAFWYAWVEDHAVTGHDYLLCGEDYQGLTVVDLTRGTTTSVLHEGYQQGHGFCVTSMLPSPDGRLLAVEGCVWASPYELCIWDFSDPTCLPLPERLRTDYEDFDRWLSPTRFRYFDYTLDEDGCVQENPDYDEESENVPEYLRHEVFYDADEGEHENHA